MGQVTAQRARNQEHLREDTERCARTRQRPAAQGTPTSGGGRQRFRGAAAPPRPPGSAPQLRAPRPGADSDWPLGGADPGARPRPRWAPHSLFLCYGPGVPAPRLSSEPPSPRRGPDVEAESPPVGVGTPKRRPGRRRRRLPGLTGLKPSAAEAARKPRRRYADRRYAGRRCAGAERGMVARVAPAQARWVEKEVRVSIAGVELRCVEHLLCIRCGSNHGRSAGSATGRTPRRWTSPPSQECAWALRSVPFPSSAGTVWIIHPTSGPNVCQSICKLDCASGHCWVTTG